MLKAKFHFGNLAKDITRRAASVAQGSMPRVAAWLRMATSLTDGREMTANRRVDSDGLL